MNEQKKLIEIFTFSSGKCVKKNDNGNYPIYGSNGIIGYCDKFNEENVILIGRAGAAGSIHELSTKAWVTDNVLIAKPKIPLEKKFLYYSLTTMNLFQYATKSAQPLLTQQILNPLKVWFPSLPEQQKIASILSTIDYLIQKTDQIIEETQILKKGLMQMLLTKGIGHTRFKKTELGEIPEEWTIVKVTDVCQGIVPGRNKPKQFNGGIPWITTEDLDDMYIKFSKKGYGVTKEEVKKASGKIIPARSVIMTCVGELGIVAVALNDIVINQQMHAFICSEKILPYYLAIFLISQTDYMYSVATTTTIPYMNKNNCNNIPLILPPLFEQQKIASILSNIDNLIRNLKSKKEDELDLKKGLMQQLLTGKIRVKV